MATSVCGSSAAKRTGPRLRRGEYCIRGNVRRHFPRCHDSSRATPEICERELRNRRKRWITQRMSTHCTATQRKSLRHIVNQPSSSILAFACVAVDKSTHDFSHEIRINDDERSRGSAWLLLFVAGQQQSVQGRDCEGANIVYAETFDAIFPVAMTVPALHRKFVNGNYATARNAG